MEIKVRNATLSDLSSILDFARHVGRFISADEVRTWLQVDSEALFVAEELPDRKLVGACCGTRLTPELGFMGLYVVLEDYRGKGIGLKLWKATKEHLGDRNIGVRGDADNFKKYSEKDGFCHVEDYTIIYYECFGYSAPKNITSYPNIEIATYFEGDFIDYSKKLSVYDSSTIAHEAHKESDADCKEVNITANVERSEKFSEQSTKSEKILSGVVDFDKSLHKRDRSWIVRQTFTWSSCRSKVALQEGKVIGYACLRQVVTQHWIISPFYADTENVAEMLLFELLKGFNFSKAPKGIQIRFPNKNIACKRLVEKFGFRKIDPEISTGFTKQCIKIDTSKVYSFHSTVFCSE